MGDDTERDSPPLQFMEADRVIGEFARHGAERIRSLTAPQVLVLGMMAGAFITTGALFSALLADGIETPGVKRLVEGFAFSTGFFFVILSGAALFTEANVVMPATAASDEQGVTPLGIARFWSLAWLGNLLGAVIVGYAVHYAQDYSPGVENVLVEVTETKLAYREEGGADQWFRIVLSGVLANWLVGMAAFFAVMGRTIIGRWIPVFLGVTMFVSANFQHSPANMGFFALVEAMGEGPGWDVDLLWSIVPAGIGNVIGGSVLVVLPWCFAARRSEVAEGDVG